MVVGLQHRRTAGGTLLTTLVLTVGVYAAGCGGEDETSATTAAAALRAITTA